MYRRVFKPKGGRVYRLRYRVGDDLRIRDVPLRTANKEIAEATADRIIDDHERELLGIGIPKALRDAAKHPLKNHLAEYIADLKERRRSKSHVKHARGRLALLFDACRWRSLRDVSDERFLTWRAENTQLSQKTRNDYLDHATSFFNWLIKQKRVTQNPFVSVFKMETKGNETFTRRALTFEEVAKLVQGSGKRGFVYLVAVGIGLRRNELKQLLWSDLHLDDPKPFVQLRAETTKAKRADIVPVVPILAESLRAAKANARHFSGLVFPHGIPMPKTLASDLQKCGILAQGERGRVDFHALKHTYSTLMGNAGVSDLAVVKLSRHKSWKMTDRYLDVQGLGLHEEMQKFGNALASSLASPKSGKTWQNEGNGVQTSSPIRSVEIIDSRSEKPILLGGDQAKKVAEGGGFEPPVGCPTSAFQAGTLNHSATPP